MRNNVVAAAVLLASLACHSAAGDEVARDIIRFKGLLADESYMVVIDSPPDRRLAARFEVVREPEGEYLTRVVTLGEGQGPLERLSKEQSAVFLQKFRSFDWNAKPKKTKKDGMVAGCMIGSPPRIAFKARVDDAYREIEADGTLMPSLADFLEVIVSDAEESNHPPEPTSGGVAHH